MAGRSKLDAKSFDWWEKMMQVVYSHGENYTGNSRLMLYYTGLNQFHQNFTHRDSQSACMLLVLNFSKI